MTKKSLQNSVLIVMLSLLLIISVAAVARFYFHNEDAYGFLKDFSSVAIAISAAYLAFCFQRRTAFLNSLRELWAEIVKSKNALISFTYKENPGRNEYVAVQQLLYDTIDLMRSVYKNVGENDRHVGLYPYEPLHDMRKSFDRCAPNATSAAARSAARTEMITAWHSLKWIFLKEFSPPEPSRPIPEQQSRDPLR